MLNPVLEVICNTFCVVLVHVLVCLDELLLLDKQLKLVGAGVVITLVLVEVCKPVKLINLINIVHP